MFKLILQIILPSSSSSPTVLCTAVLQDAAESLQPPSPAAASLGETEIWLVRRAAGGEVVLQCGSPPAGRAACRGAGDLPPGPNCHSRPHNTGEHWYFGHILTFNLHRKSFVKLQRFNFPAAWIWMPVCYEIYLNANIKVSDLTECEPGCGSDELENDFHHHLSPQIKTVPKNYQSNYLRFSLL